MWQEIIIAIIAVVVVGYVGYKIYHLLTKQGSLCDNCAGCSLKEQLKDKSRNCKEFKHKKD
jgi:hypothetical protein